MSCVLAEACADICDNGYAHTFYYRHEYGRAEPRAAYCIMDNIKNAAEQLCRRNAYDSRRRYSSDKPHLLIAFFDEQRAQRSDYAYRGPFDNDFHYS